MDISKAKKYLIGKPYTISIPTVVKKYITAFPKSGCLSVRKKIGERIKSAFRNLLNVTFSFVDKKCARTIMKKGFIISEN